MNKFFVRHKKIILVIIGLILLSVIVILATTDVSKKQIEKTPRVLRSYPPQKEVVLTFPRTISAYFDTNLTGINKNRFKITSDDMADVAKTSGTGANSESEDISFEINKNKLSIDMSNIERKNKQYKIKIFFDSKEIYEFDFTYNDFDDPVVKKVVSEQSENDYILGEVSKQFARDYPWYSKLPIKTADYTIMYSFDRTLFTIYFTKTGQLNKPTNLESAITEIVNLTGYKREDIKYELLN